jgi:predicted GNAT family acetyltransferase
MEYFTIENVTESSEAPMCEFLKGHENYSLFLLSNFLSCGRSLTDEPNSGNFKLIKQFGKIVGVFCLTRRKNFLVQSDVSEPVFSLVLEACKKEPIPIEGVLGDWDFCNPFWQFLKSKGIIGQETYTSKEILYTLNTAHPYSPKYTNVRLLTEADFDQWQPLELAYIREQGFPVDLTDEQMKKQFLFRVSQKAVWGMIMNDGRLVSLAELNAKAFDVGQLGGVFTHPDFRRRGFSKAVLQHLLSDAKEIHKLRKLVLFTDVNNSPARKLYEALQADVVGHFALLFGHQ